MSPDLMTIARAVMSEHVPDNESAESAERSPDAPLRSLSALIAQPGRGARRGCWTCGASATGTWDDGSPRFDHGHDAVTGITWTHPRSRRVAVGRVRTCPGCGIDHAVGTTCDAPVHGAESAKSAESTTGLRS